jgi:hypothetical protein
VLSFVVTVGHQLTPRLQDERLAPSPHYEGLVLRRFAEGSVRTPPGTSTRRRSFPLCRNARSPERSLSRPSNLSPYPLSPSVSQISSTRAGNSFPLINLRKTGESTPQCSTWNHPTPQSLSVLSVSSVVNIPFSGSAVDCRLAAVDSLLTRPPQKAAATWLHPHRSLGTGRLPQATPHWSLVTRHGSLATGHGSRPLSAILWSGHLGPSFTPSVACAGRFGRAANFNRKAVLLP